MGNYDIVVGLIQSNMRGAATDYDGTDAYPASVDMWNWGTSSIVAAAEPTSSRDTPVGMGVGNTFCKDWAATRLTAGRKVLFVNAARGGTGFSTPSSNSDDAALTWDRTAANDSHNLAQTTLTALGAVLTAAGPGSRIVAYIANHGSTDGINNMAKATYKAALQDWITWLRAQMNTPTVPYLMMQMRPDLVAAETRHAIIDEAQQETAGELARVGWVASPVGAGYYKADAVHFNAAGVRIIGHSLFSMLQARFPVTAGQVLHSYAKFAGVTTELEPRLKSA